MKNLGIMLGIALTGLCGHAWAGDLIQNGDFSTGDFTDWTTYAGFVNAEPNGSTINPQTIGGNGWEVASGLAGAFALSSITSPGDGSNHFSAFNAFNGSPTNGSGNPLYNGAFTMSMDQNFVNPGSGDVILSFDYHIKAFVFNEANGGTLYGNIDAGRDFSVNVLNGSGNVVSTLFDRAFAATSSTVDTGVVSVSIDVSSQLAALGNGTFALDFRSLIPQYNTGSGTMVIDNVHMRTEGAPEPFTMSLGLAGAGLFIRRRMKRTRATPRAA